MNGKFLHLYESVFNKYQRGGFLAGDYVKFVDKFKSHDEYHKLPENVKEIIDDMIKTGLNLRVNMVKPKDPAYSAGNAQLNGSEFVADVVIDHGGGRYIGFISVPTCLLKPDPAYPNLNKMAASQNDKDRTQIKPSKVKQDAKHPTNQSDAGKGKLKPTDVSLPDKNTTIANSNSSYTRSYMP